MTYLEVADVQQRNNPIRRRLSRRFQVSLVWEGALVGLFAGALVTLYRLALTWGEKTLRSVIASSGSNPLNAALWFLALVVMAVVVAALVRWEPATSGSGIPQVDAEVMGAMEAPWHRVIGAKFIEGTLGAIGGLSLGREGPSVQLGGMAGKGVSRILKRGRGEERLLVTCGAGAGMAAAFHAPLTGVMFALEEIHKTFNAPLIISVMMSAVMSDYVTSQVLGLQPVISFKLAEVIPHEAYGILIVFGLVMGVIGALHNAGMFQIQNLLSKIRYRSAFMRYLIPFAIAGLAALTAPDLMCGGDAILELLMRPQGMGLLALTGLLIGKYLFTGVCFGAGTPGGTLFPLVIMGALTGAIFGTAATRFLGMSPDLVMNFMVLGIAGMFAGAIRAPVTAVVLAFELTGSLEQLLSLAIVSVIAYVTANLMQVDAYYEHLLARQLGTTPEETHERWGSHGRQLHSYVIEAGCSAADKLISEIDWPQRTLVVSVRRCGRELVPSGSTRLLEGDRILVLLDEREDDDSERFVRWLCHGTFAPVEAKSQE